MVLEFVRKIFAGDQRGDKVIEPRVIPASEHQISHSQIGRNALRVLHRLKDAGFEACLVGGSVRDLLLGHRPKDFDVATNALPQEVSQIFHHSRIIGRRFRLVHVRFGREIVEVATFRGPGERFGKSKHRYNPLGMLMRDNTYGSIDDDVWRRDCTINALYYDIKDMSVIDYTGGVDDLKAKRIRIVGDPVARYREDPVRMLRVIRFAAKLGFMIDVDTAEAIPRLKGLIQNVSPARLFIEAVKLFHTGHGKKVFYLLREYDLFGELFHQTEANLLNEFGRSAEALIAYGLHHADERYAVDMPMSEGYLFAVLLWYPLQRNLRKYRREAYEAGMPKASDLELAGDAVLAQQSKQTAMTRRAADMVRGIWSLQYRLARRRPREVHRLVHHLYFKAAYDFLLLRAQAGEGVDELAMWWETYYTGDDKKRQEMLEALPDVAGNKVADGDAWGETKKDLSRQRRRHHQSRAKNRGPRRKRPDKQS